MCDSMPLHITRKHVILACQVLLLTACTGLSAALIAAPLFHAVGVMNGSNDTTGRICSAAAKTHLDRIRASKGLKE